MRLDELQNHRAELARIAAKYGIRRVYVFGSVARGESTAASDADFLVELEENASGLSVGGFQYEVERLLGVRVDVVPRFALPRVADRAFAEAVEAEAVPL
ncbi:MAG: nucleotidyltransferase domain-containing protein [Chloroflexi bacterium]|nr:nucleotidyltransferase domain-containing protein [Chloroflexota bacterium]